MATQADVRRIALALAGTEETPGRFAFSVRNKGKPKGFVWVASLDDKYFLLGLDEQKFFTEPHYNGLPAVLVRLPAVTARELKPTIAEAWGCQAPKEPLPEEKPRRHAHPAG